MKITQELTLDTSRENAYKVVHAKQYDEDSRFLKVTITTHGEEIDVPSDATVVFGVKRADLESHDFAGVVNADGTVTVPITNWMLQVAGKCVCDVSIIKDGEKFSTLNFSVLVEYAPTNEADITEDEGYDVLVSLVERVENVVDHIDELEQSALSAEASAAASAKSAENTLALMSMPRTSLAPTFEIDFTRYSENPLNDHRISAEVHNNVGMSTICDKGYCTFTATGTDPYLTFASTKYDPTARLCDVPAHQLRYIVIKYRAQMKYDAAGEFYTNRTDGVEWGALGSHVKWGWVCDDEWHTVLVDARYVWGSASGDVYLHDFRFDPLESMDGSTEDFNGCSIDIAYIKFFAEKYQAEAFMLAEQEVQVRQGIVVPNTEVYCAYGRFYTGTHNVQVTGRWDGAYVAGEDVYTVTDGAVYLNGERVDAILAAPVYKFAHANYLTPSKKFIAYNPQVELYETVTGFVEKYPNHAPTFVRADACYFITPPPVVHYGGTEDQPLTQEQIGALLGMFKSAVYKEDVQEKFRALRVAFGLEPEEPHVHSYQFVSKQDPTCTTDGQEVHECECGAQNLVVLPATGHTESDWIIDTEAQPGVDGSKHTECTVCGETINTEVIPALELVDPAALPAVTQTCCDAIHIDGVEVVRSSAAVTADAYLRGTLANKISTATNSVIFEGWINHPGGFDTVGYLLNGRLVQNQAWMVEDAELCGAVGADARRYFIEIDTSSLAVGTYEVALVAVCLDDYDARFLSNWGTFTVEVTEPDGSDVPVDPDGFELYRVISSDELVPASLRAAYDGYSTTSTTYGPYSDDATNRLSYIEFDIVCEEGYTYKIEYEADSDVAGVGIEIANEACLEAVATQSDFAMADNEDLGWAQSGDEFTPSSVYNGRKPAAIRFTFKGGTFSHPNTRVEQVIIRRKAAEPEEPHTHNYQFVSKQDATCTTDGQAIYSCECGSQNIVPIPATGHTESDWIIDTEAQPGVDGSKHTECTVCGETINTEVIPALELVDPAALPAVTQTCCDALWIDGVEIYRSSASGTVDGYFASTMGSVVNAGASSVLFEGWIWASGSFSSVGYVIDGQLVENADWLQYDQGLVAAQGGNTEARRYFVEIDTAALAAGTYTVGLVAQNAADGQWYYMSNWGVFSIVVADADVPVDEGYELHRVILADELVPASLRANYAGNTGTVSIYGPYCDASTGRLSYIGFDIPCEGGATYKVAFEADSTVTYVGVEAFNEACLEAVDVQGNFTASDRKDLGWLANGAEFTLEDTYNNREYAALRITFKGSSAFSTTNKHVERVIITRKVAE